MKPRSYTVVYEAAEGGGFYAHVPALGLTTEGVTMRHAKAMARDAVEGYLEAARELGKRVPKDVRVERLEITA